MYVILLLFVTSSWAMCPLNCRCTFEVTNCSAIELSTVPDVDPNVENLILSNNKLTVVNLARDLTNLRIVDLSNNSLQRVQFPLLNFVEDVNLSNNQLTELDIGHLQSLTKLNLSRNKWSGKELKSDSLELLDISRNNLTTFGYNIFRPLPKLKTLVIAYNPIISTINLSSTSLETLDVTDCDIRNLNPKLLKNHFPNLVKLIASHNKHIKILLSGIDLKIENADFAHSNVKNFSISSLKSLMALDFSHNKLKAIYDSSFNSNSLMKKLNLSSNSIEHVSLEAFKFNQDLVILDLSHNLLTLLDWTSFLTNLITFDASYNKIALLTNFELLNAKEIDLSHNLIQDLTIDISKTLPEVGDLNLRYNAITYLKPLKSKTLERLWLGYCKLKVLYEKTFEDVPYLMILDLEGNQFKALDYRVLRNAPRLSQVKLGGNQWKCNCNNEEFSKLFIYSLVNNSLTNSNTLVCDNKQQWTDMCKPAKFTKSTEFNEKVFVWVGVFFLVALATALILMYCKGRQKPVIRETTVLPAEQNLLPTITIRRAHSAAEILNQRSPPPPPFVDHDPPPYEEAIRMPPLTETERMTRSLEVLLNR